MRIKSVDFAGAVAAPGGKAPPGRLPEIAFVGRSNVGKSSLINRLLGRTRSPIARVSVRPGKTQEINFYRVRAALEPARGSALPPREKPVQEPEPTGDSAGATTDRRRMDPVQERVPTAGARPHGIELDLEFFLVDLPGYSFARVPAAVRARWKPLIESYLSSSRTLRGVVQLIDARHEPTADDRTMVQYLAALNVPTLFALTKIDKLTRSQRQMRVSDAAEELDVDGEQVVPFSAATGEGRELLLDSIAELLLDPTPRLKRTGGES